MSLILEALKKSEAQRRLGEAPNLGTPFTATRKRRSPLPWITLAVVLVAAAGGWWILSPQTEGSTAQNGAAPATQPMPAGPIPPARKYQSVRERAQAAAQAAASASPAPPITVIAPPAGHPPITAPTAAPAAAGAGAKPPIVAAPPPTPAPTPPAVPATKSAVANVPAPARSTDAKAVGTGTAPVAAAPPPPASTPTPPPTPAPQPVVAPPAAPAAPAEPAIPTVNNLAFELRRDLPDLPVSMQVYSADPAHRFILVGGERKKEGDMIRDVAVREIRTNGVVLEFRGQRFLLPRPGS